MKIININISAKLHKKIFYEQATRFFICRFNTNAKISKKLGMYFNKASVTVDHKPKFVLIILLLCLFTVGTSCNTSKKAYRPKKQKKKDCDCSEWSYNNTSSDNYYLLS